MTTLWRAASVVDPWFGYGSFWASRRGHAESYRARPGFGGPAIYQAKVIPEALLDLRTDPWTVIAERFGLDRDDYPTNTPDHELLADLVNVFAVHGHDWLVFTIGDETGADDEWVYLGDEAISASQALAANLD